MAFKEEGLAHPGPLPVLFFLCFACKWLVPRVAAVSFPGAQDPQRFDEDIRALHEASVGKGLSQGTPQEWQKIAHALSKTLSRAPIRHTSHDLSLLRRLVRRGWLHFICVDVVVAGAATALRCTLPVVRLFRQEAPEAQGSSRRFRSSWRRRVKVSASLLRRRQMGWRCTWVFALASKLRKTQISLLGASWVVC